MELLSKQSAQTKIKKDNEQLVDMNLRLRKYFSAIKTQFNTLKDNYEPDKVKKLEEFNRFCSDIDHKKSLKLEELSVIDAEIEKKKEIYYGLISKQDELDEKIYQLSEKERKLDLREGFVEELERKWKEKQQ
jgi:hypothetical protein